MTVFSDLLVEAQVSMYRSLADARLAIGLFAGYTASYIFGNSWRHQILSGAVPAFALLLSTWASCECVYHISSEDRFTDNLQESSMANNPRGVRQGRLVL